MTMVSLTVCVGDPTDAELRGSGLNQSLAGRVG